MPREDYERAEAEERNRACGELTTHEFVWIPLKDGRVDWQKKAVKIVAEGQKEAEEQVIDDLVEASGEKSKGNLLQRCEETGQTFDEIRQPILEARDEAREQEGKTWLVMMLY